MRVEQVSVSRLSVPMAKPMRTAIHSQDRTENVLVEIAADGLVGQGCSLTLNAAHADAVRAVAESLASMIIGSDPFDHAALWQKLRQSLNLTGQSGIGMLALSTIDTGLWDLAAQKAGLPLSAVLGRAHTELPVYTQGGWLSYTVEELTEEALAAKAAGFRHYKMRVGSHDWRSDIARVIAVVEAVGPEVKIMVDANQGWLRHEAMQAVRALDGLGLYWIEEPLNAHDLEGAAAISEAATTPIALGESLFGLPEFTHAIALRAADVLMLDLQHCGGPTGFMAVAALADAAQVPVSTHLFMETSVHLLAACPGALILEYMPGWWDELFDPKPSIDCGTIKVPTAPGIGYRITAEAKRRFRTV